MKLVRISERAKAMLRNRKVASAVAKALASNHGDSKDGIEITINGKIYTVKRANVFARKKSA
jgi:hypothetical protein